MSLRVHLRHRLGDLPLEVDFDAPAGVTALFGRSGAGKTSVINAIAGLLRCDTARIEVAGTVLVDTERGIWLPPHKRAVGYVFQDARLFPHLSVAGNLRYGQRFARSAPLDEARVVDLLGLASLMERRPAGLSGGEKQRVAIGRALLCAPRLLLMDEPLAALDDARKAEILPYIERLRDGLNLPVIYVSHAVAEVARLADTVVLIDKGRTLRAGPVADILADPAAAPALGIREAGALLAGHITAHTDDGLTEFAFAGGSLLLPRQSGAPGTPLRVRIEAQDVMIALDHPRAISALNVLPASIASVRQGAGPGALVQLTMGDARLLARVTQRSVAALGLTSGMACYAVIKSVSVAQNDVGAG